jgi:K+-sensing histidine kinase KdpD
VNSPQSALNAADAARERGILRDLAYTLARAPRPESVYTLALERVTPWIGASFSSVFVRDQDPATLTLAAAHQWPPRYRDWIGELRIRIGRGPSGLAVGEGRLVEVADLFADPDLAEWQSVARELDMRSMLAAPLRASTGVLGALTFYFANETAISDRERELVESVADHVALAAERAMLEQELRRGHAALVDSNAELERQYADVVLARAERDRFLGAFAGHLSGPLRSMTTKLASVQHDATALPLTVVQQVANEAEQLARVAHDVEQLALLRRGALAITLGEFDPRQPMRAVTDARRGAGMAVDIRVHEPLTQLPSVRTDASVIVTILGFLVDHALAAVTGGIVDVSCDLGRGWVAWRVAYEGGGETSDQMRVALDESAAFSAPGRGPASMRLPLARRWAQRLGGELRWDEDATRGAAFSLIVPIDARPDASIGSMND